VGGQVGTAVHAGQVPRRQACCAGGDDDDGAGTGKEVDHGWAAALAPSCGSLFTAGPEVTQRKQNNSP